MASLALSSTSRYKDTALYSQGGVLEFALFEPPAEFDLSVSGAITHRVSDYEVGFLDQIAVRYYGPGYEHLWWVIALANGIIDPDVDVYPGLAIRIPARDDVLAFVMCAGKA